jgi:asparagine synthase (glutamine-hydrolysing)
MCGIGGNVSTKSLDIETITQTLNSMCKRGPDGVRHQNLLLSNTSLDLMFSRLAIIDQSEKAMQPIAYGHHIILLNGEIYNYKELRNFLEVKHGSQNWSSNGDVEVALRYLVLNGIESVKDFDGMFAFALVDLQNENIYFGRDYFGEKPLYILNDKASIVFGSEPKIIWAIRNKQNSINRNHVFKFLESGYKSLFKNNEDFFKGLYRIEPGTIESYSLKSLQRNELIKFRKIESHSPKSEKYKSRDQQLQNIKKTIIESVGRRLESDVPLAICLSGGIDSGLIASIAKRDFGVSLAAYTLVSIDPRYSEAKNAATVATYLNLDHTLVEIDPTNFIVRLNQITKYHEAPISTLSYYVQNFLTEKIHSDGFKVSLMGSGADEIFTGYYDHHLLYLASMYNQDPQLFKTSLDNWKDKVLPLIRNPIYQKFDRYIKQPDFRSHIYEGSEIMMNMLLNHPQNLFSEELFSESLLKNRMLNELFHEVIPVILHEDDRNSMMYSVENRSPFLSVRILESTLGIEDQAFIQDGLTKYLLREAFDDYLPKEILYSHKKIGFNASILELCNFQSSEFKQFMKQDSILWDIMDKNKVKDFFDNLGAEDIYNKTAFNIISSKAFCDIFG